jgi:micrococcal nuclease
MHRLLLISLILFSSCIETSNKAEKEFTDTYKVISISDGDTYTILVDNEPVKIRMHGIDAPEKGMPFYRVAKKKLSKLCLGIFIRIEKIDTDQYDRMVAKGFLDDGSDINLEMIKSGLAWHYKEYSSDQTYAEAEELAKQSKIGLWIDPHPKAPWEIRKLHKQGISTKDSFSSDIR